MAGFLFSSDLKQVLKNEKYYLKIHAKILSKKNPPQAPQGKIMRPKIFGAAATILLMRVTKVFFLLAPNAPIKKNEAEK